MDQGEKPRVLNRQIVLLVGLGLAAVVVFIITKRMAAKEQQLENRLAAIWFDKGQKQIRSGEPEEAIHSFRWASADARENHKYSLALADALGLGNHYAEAQQLLLRLRESDPENAEINARLARLASKRGVIPDALHYYQNALYGRWAGSQVDEQRRQLRIELIRFLLGHGENNRAASELLILETEPPVSAGTRVETADLFLQSGNLQSALKNYVEAVQLERHNAEALAGAGETSFQLGDYAKAAHYLRMASEVAPKSAETREHLSLAEMVLAQDPLAPHLTSKQRQSRLLPGLERAKHRLEDCLSASNHKGGAEFQSLKAEALALEPKLHRPRPPDYDLVKSAVELVFKMEKTASEACGTPPLPDQAWLLIGAKQEGAQP